MKKLKVISVITHSNGYLPLLESHLKSNNIDYKFLGYGEKWKGWKWRTDILENELKKIDKNKYIVAIIDGWDVLMFDDEKTILEKYKKHNKDIVLSYNTLNKDQNQFSMMLNKYKKRVFNGGIYIGNPKSILELFSKVRDSYHNDTAGKKPYDDEVELNIFLNKKENSEYINSNIHYDYSHDFVITYHPVLELNFNNNIYEIKNKKIIFKNGYSPSFIHTVAHYSKDIVDTYDLKTKHIRSINLKQLFNDLKYLNIVLFLFLLLLVVSFSLS